MGKITSRKERLACLVETLETITGSQLSLVEAEQAALTGVHVTQHGYSLSWSESLGWVVQLPLDCPGIWAVTLSLSCLTGTVRHYGSTGVLILTKS